MTADEKIAAACRDAVAQDVARAERTGTHVIVRSYGQIVRMSPQDKQ